MQLLSCLNSDSCLKHDEACYVNLYARGKILVWQSNRSSKKKHFFFSFRETVKRAVSSQSGKKMMTKISVKGNNIFSVCRAEQCGK